MCARRAAVTALMLFVIACSTDADTSLMITLGLRDAVPLPAERIDILCDPSPGSSCTPETLGKALDEVLSHASLRGGTTIALYGLGNSMADTRLLGTEAISVGKTNSERAARAQIAKQIAAAKGALLRAAADYFKRPPKRSPLIEGIAKISALDSPDHLVIISDALEQSELARFECATLPTVAQFASAVQREKLLEPRSIHGSVTFAYRDLRAIDSGCNLSFARVREIEALWSSTLKSAGAQQVSFTAAAPNLAQLDALVRGASPGVEP